MAVFTTTEVEFRSKSGVVFGMGCKNGRMYQMQARAKSSKHQDFIAIAKGRTLDKWHRVFGHVNAWTIKTLKRNNLVTGLEVDESQVPTQCMACIQGKRHVEPFPKKAEEEVENTSDLIVSDVWGPAQIEGPNREKYLFSFTDVKSQYTELFFKSTKDEALKHFLTFKEFVETQTGHKLK